MTRGFLLTLTGLILFIPAFTQTILLKESFGSVSWSGNPDTYPYYTGDAFYSGDDPHSFPLANSEGYSGASGGGAIIMGNWNTPANTEFIIQYNTSQYINVQLAFGMKHNSGGWGTCQLSNNYTLIEYSIDSANWNTIDKAFLREGSTWPCADDEAWSFVMPAQVLPSSENLYIRFTHTDPTVHPFYLDDITLTGYSPDYDPPSKPTNIRADSIRVNTATLVWNASADEGGIKLYKVYKDGYYLLSTQDTVAEIKYQIPGSSAEFSVIAYDLADNASVESDPLPLTFLEKPHDYKYSWENRFTTILPSGKLKWKPEEFNFNEGSSVRYIDFENGDDTNDGLTKSTPWKHHPWDSNAESIAAGASGIHTYVFKRGVVYRGQLVAGGSGTPLEPIRLTSDPTWGSGEAYFFGSKRISGTWKRANAATAPSIPNPERVWYMDVDMPQTKMICEIEDDKIKEIKVARSPNYKYTPDDPLKTWYTWTGKYTTSGGLWLSDSKNLTQTDPDYYKGATVFSQEDAIVMCTVWKQNVMEWDPLNHRIKVADNNFGGTGTHYFIENTPFLLDTTSEFYYDRTRKKLYLRLEDDKDPNNTIIEAASLTELIRIDNKHDIEISGICFGITTVDKVRYGEADAYTTIRMTGICNNINISNNQFWFTAGGISINNIGSAEVNTHSISVTDNNFQHIADLAIVFSTNTVYMDDINILRNNIYITGYRHQGRWYSSIPAIYGQLNYGEIAGNIIDVSWGNGLDMFWGKGSGSDRDIPFIRGLVHHNSASNTLIGTNDYGGIESWQGGPVYCYNNYSHNASGFKHFANQSIGYAYYFDGAFKQIVFNNIASGVSNGRNSASIMQVLGFYNMFVHNSAYKTNIFFNAWKNNLALCGYNAYLGNVGEDIDFFFKHEIRPENIPFDSYGFNVAGGTAFRASLENLNDNLSLSGFISSLENYNTQLSQGGYNSPLNVLPLAKVPDFRPYISSEAIDNGVRFFTAFPLSRVVGEWNFYKHPADLSIIMADNFYMTEDYTDRETYKDIPKNHLKAYNITEDNFMKGPLEDWTEGCLKFDGSVYCSVDHSVASQVKSNNVDMEANDFIVEAFLKTAYGHTNGAIISKYNGAEGYEMTINNSGKASMALYVSGTAVCARESEVILNDSLWHHLLVEVNRNAGIDMYVDGVLSNGTLTGTMPSLDQSLSNSADFLVGKDIDENHFLGSLDFLRISRGSLYDAKTTVDEIYTWETNGPFLYDLKGNAPVGKRDAGAIESLGGCTLSVSQSDLEYDYTSSAQDIIVTAADGFVVEEKNDFYSSQISGDTLRIFLDQNEFAEERSANLSVYGCGTSKALSIHQSGAPCYLVSTTDTLKLTYHEQYQSIDVMANTEFSAEIQAGSFVDAGMIYYPDSILIKVGENTSTESRYTALTISGCEIEHVVTIVQEGAPCKFFVASDSLNFTSENQELSVYINSNDEFNFTFSGDPFFTAITSANYDSLIIITEENQSANPRSAELLIEACDGTHTIKIVQEGVTGISNNYGDGGPKIYPNPVSGNRIHIEIPGEIKSNKYSLASISGKILQNGFIYSSYETIKLDVDSGTYILTVSGEDKIYRARIVVR